MKQNRFRPEADDSAFADNSCRDAAARQAQRKTCQFCRQVQRALHLALANSDVLVDDVLPAPDCGRLLVYVLIPQGADVAATIADLRRQSPGLRAEVARSITRKRAPELVFAPVGSEGIHDA